MSKDTRVYLAQILERISRILDYTSEGRQSFMNDMRTQDAVIRNLEVIGEAVKRIPEEFRKAHPHIPWRALAGLRDVLIHQYDSVNPAEIWQAIDADLKPLQAEIQAALLQLEQPQEEVVKETKETGED
ncbi:MAG: DUF86 domain-containing protein [Chloracidobacterium sp.]|nr:DUF86 domain-containing protein [Chloracidobacterium sp.]MDW8216691.1 DUF86 domain-containing protein [Acidobacteriota bacterium]